MSTRLSVIFALPSTFEPFMVLLLLFLGGLVILFIGILFLSIQWISNRIIRNAVEINELTPKIIKKAGQSFVILKPLNIFKIGMVRVKIKERFARKNSVANTLFSSLRKKLLEGINASVLLQKHETRRSVSVVLYKKGFFESKIVNELLRAVESLKGNADLSGYEIDSLDTSLTSYSTLSTLLDVGIVKQAQGAIQLYDKKVRPTQEGGKRTEHEKQDFFTGINFLKDLPTGSSIVYSLKSAKMHKEIRQEKEADQRSYNRGPYEISIGMALYTPLPRGKLFTKSHTHLHTENFNSFARAVIHISKDENGGISFKSSVGTLLTSIIPSKEVTVKGNSEEVLFCPIQKMLRLSTVFDRGGETPNLTPTLNSYSNGPIHIGDQMFRGEKVSPFALTVEDLKDHLAIIGKTGSGKSMLARRIVEKLRKNSHSTIWVFDFHGEWIDLAMSDFKVVSPATRGAPLSLNIFDPQDDLPSNHANFLSNLICEVLKSGRGDLSPQMRQVLTVAIQETVSSKKRRGPLFFIESLWSETQDMSTELSSSIKTFQALINRLGNFFEGTPRNVFWTYETNVDLQKLASQNVVFDLSGLSRRGGGKKAHTLLVNVLLKYLLSYFYKIRKFQVGKTPRMFIIFEEARWFIPWQRKESSAETTTTEDLAILSRKYGISLIFINQSWETLSRAAINNVSSKFIMRGEIPQNFRSFSTNVRKYVQQMAKREVIVDLSDALEPLLVKVAECPPPKIDLERYRTLLLKKGTNLRAKYAPIRTPFNKLVKRITNGESISEKMEKNTNNKVITLCNSKDSCKLLSFMKLAVGEVLREGEFKLREDLLQEVPQSPGNFMIEEVLKQVGEASQGYKVKNRCIVCSILHYLVEEEPLPLSETIQHEIAYKLFSTLKSPLPDVE
ncbi:MAG: ATP-binding protein [Candidatus Korarchaeota archaeon]|nr:ATP-binding protein [Candidatus Korarchaeota archaeon]NIU83259.1 DUF87 domain-containing protein [Candidatus Thorarchaeota archaeon]NIW13603.1 DUF87 domain-containing protein [Candidatus Thorarchaeota archaeon]NIW51699.1 DUF87 domain-containing protein [Candidatus Korarchaeota archaeon]